MALSLGSPFADHMVLQTGRPVPVWGWAEPASQVTVSFADQQATAIADDSGAWSLKLASLEVSSQGRDFTVTAQSTSGTETLTLKDVVVGEVWLCSGQSNMQWTIALLEQEQEEAPHSHDSLLRVLTVPRAVSETPEKRFSSPATWELSCPETIGGFTAVGYFFGKELRRRLNVPIGLVSSSWGGTIIEAWTSREGLLATEAGARIRKHYDQNSDNIEEAYAKWEQSLNDISDRYRDAENCGLAQGWAGPDEPADAQWRDVEVPGIWQNQGFNHHGIIWFRREVDLPAAWAGRELLLSLGAADKSDDTYFNNVHVGSLKYEDDKMSWSIVREYPIPGHLVKAGRNVIASRIRSYMCAGGLVGPATKMFISCPSLPDQEPLPLRGTWRAAVEANYGVVEVPPAPPGRDQPNAPSRLYNTMIHPIEPYALRGEIWYQGESNAARHYEYAELLKGLILDMRRLWNDPQQPFYIVQLASFRARNEEPVDESWAYLREAQTDALVLPHTGMAVTIDIGEANNIHPSNKLDVGLRLAYNALHYTYGMKDVVPCGPLFKQAVVKQGEIELRFNHTDGGLELRIENGKSGFAIAGADKRFVWADARVECDAVYVRSVAVPEPKFVRYGWSDNPPISLYNKAGLPASPFRTDRD